MKAFFSSELLSDLNSLSQDIAGMAAERILVSAFVSLCVVAVVLGLRNRLSAHAKSWLWLLPLVTLVVPLERGLPGFGLREKLELALLESPSPLPPKAPDASGVSAEPISIPESQSSRVDSAASASTHSVSQTIPAMGADTSSAKLEARIGGGSVDIEQSKDRPLHPSDSFSGMSLLAALWLSVSFVLLLTWRRKHTTALNTLRRGATRDDQLTQSLSRALGARTHTRMPWLQRATCPRINIAYSSDLSSPATLPGAQPLILLPHSLASEVTEAERMWIIHHELAHILRGDLWIMMVQKLIQMLWWWNPLMLLTVRELEHQRECACDDVATAMIGGRQNSGARALITVMTLAAKPTPSLPAFASLLHPRSRIRRRFMRLIRDRGQVTPGLSGLSRIAIMLVGAAALAAAKPAQQAPAEPGPRVLATTQAPPLVEKAEPRADASLAVPLPQEAEPSKQETAKKLVAGASAWLLKHQKDSGAWPIGATNNRPQHGMETHVSTTARATLALMDATRLLGKDRVRDDAAAKGISWLAEQQTEDGCIGPRAGSAWAFGHFMAIQAFAQAYELRPTKALKATVTGAIEFLGNMQNPYRGWRYDIRSGDNDSKMTSLAIVAVQAAARMGVESDSIHLDWANEYLNDLTDPRTGHVGWMKRGQGAGRLYKHDKTHPGELSEENTAVAAVHWIEGGRSPAKDRQLQGAISVVFRRLPEWNMREGTVDYEYWYWGSRLMAHLGGWQWKAWKSAIEETIIERAQWKQDGTVTWPLDDAWSKKGLGVYATARNLRTLVITHGPLPAKITTKQRKK